jgi:hypothetical protein
MRTSRGVHAFFPASRILPEKPGREGRSCTTRRQDVGERGRVESGCEFFPVVARLLTLVGLADAWRTSCWHMTFDLTAQFVTRGHGVGARARGTGRSGGRADQLLVGTWQGFALLIGRLVPLARTGRASRQLFSSMPKRCADSASVRDRAVRQSAPLFAEDLLAEDSPHDPGGRRARCKFVQRRRRETCEPKA